MPTYLVGFAQIKNYGTLKQTLREIYLYAKYYQLIIQDFILYRGHKYKEESYE